MGLKSYSLELAIFIASLLSNDIVSGQLSDWYEVMGRQSQPNVPSTCHTNVIKPSTAKQRYIVGCNSFHVPILEYLTKLIGLEFDPPIYFERFTANNYLKTNSVEDSAAIGYDFMLANPYMASCFETEGQAINLATQIRSLASLDPPYNMTQYGSVLFALENRTDIQGIMDIRGKKVGTNKITSLAT